MIRSDADEPRAAFSVENEKLPVVLAHAAAAINQSVIYLDLPSLQRASFGMGRGWGLRWGTEFTVELAPGAPREPIPGAPPPPEVSKERVARVVARAEGVLTDRDAVVEEITLLLNDPTTRRHALLELQQAIGMLAALRSPEAADDLARYIDLSGDGFGTVPAWMGVRGGEVRGAPQSLEQRRALYRDWLRGHVALGALVAIGRPAVPAIIDVLAVHHVAPIPHAVTASTLSHDVEAKTVLLCEAIVQILGTERAVAALEAAAQAEPDAHRAEGMRDGAERIRKGLGPQE